MGVIGERRVPNDPGRPVRILEAALEVIGSQGLHRASHRRIAAAAGVSPGSLTYYYASIEDIYAEAFTLLITRMSSRYEESMAQAPDREAAIEAVTDLIRGTYADHHNMVLIFEMYAYANHDPRVAALTADWTALSRASLARHFSPQACRAIDALVEGWPMHREFEKFSPDRHEVTVAIRSIVAAWDTD